MLKKNILRLAVFLIILSLIIAATGCGEGEKEEGALPTVVYGGSAWLGHYPAMVGIETGIFEEEGIRVIFQGFYTSSGRMGSLASGQLDAVSTGSISAVALMASGNRDFYVVGSQDSYDTLEGIIATKDIKSVEDLRGKKLAATFASSSHVLVLDILDRYGIDPEKDIELVNLEVYDMPTAIQSGEIDAAAAWTPAFENLMALDNTHLLLDDREFSLYKEYGLGPGPDMIVLSKAFVDKNPETTKKFLQGWFKATQYMIDHPDESAEIIADYTGLDLETQKATLKEITWHGLEKQYEFLVDPGSYVTGLEMLADLLVRYNQLDEAPDVKEWINYDVLPELE